MTLPKLTPILNNCALHALTPELKIEINKFANDEHYNNKNNANYNLLKNHFAAFYGFNAEEFTWKQFATLLNSYNPFDTQVLMGPVMRQFIKEQLEANELTIVCAIDKGLSKEAYIKLLTEVSDSSGRYTSIAYDELSMSVAGPLGIELHYQGVGGDGQPIINIQSAPNPIVAIKIFHQDGGSHGDGTGAHWERTLEGKKSTDYSHGTKFGAILSLLEGTPSLFGISLLAEHVRLTNKMLASQDPLVKSFKELDVTAQQVSKFLYNLGSVSKKRAIELLGAPLTDLALAYIHGNDFTEVDAIIALEFERLLHTYQQNGPAKQRLSLAEQENAKMLLSRPPTMEDFNNSPIYQEQGPAEIILSDEELARKIQEEIEEEDNLVKERQQKQAAEDEQFAATLHEYEQQHSATLGKNTEQDNLNAEKKPGVIADDSAAQLPQQGNVEPVLAAARILQDQLINELKKQQKSEKTVTDHHRDERDHQAREILDAMIKPKVVPALNPVQESLETQKQQLINELKKKQQDELQRKKELEQQRRESELKKQATKEKPVVEVKPETEQPQKAAQELHKKQQQRIKAELEQQRTRPEPQKNPAKEKPIVKAKSPVENPQQTSQELHKKQQHTEQQQQPIKVELEQQRARYEPKKNVAKEKPVVTAKTPIKNPQQAAQELIQKQQKLDSERKEELKKEKKATPPKKQVPAKADEMVAPNTKNAVEEPSILNKEAEPIANDFHERFQKSIKVLNNKLKDFKDKPDCLKAYQATETLYKALKEEGNQYFLNTPTQASFQKFKNNCEGYIKTARTELDNHRGFVKIFLNILAIILTAGIGYAVATGVNMASNKGKFTLFSTDSSIKLNDIENDINDLAPSA